MSTSTALQFLSIVGPDGDETELWNQARLDAYLRSGIVPSGFTVEAAVGIGLVDILPNEPVYIAPAFDGAPWWDPHNDVEQRAARFAGVLPLEVIGLDDSTSTVDVIGTADGGVAFANRRDMPREVTVRALLVGQDCCATRYGLLWLKEALADAAGDSGASQLQWISCMPEAASTVTTPSGPQQMFYADGTPMLDSNGNPMTYSTGGTVVAPAPMFYEDGEPLLYEDGRPLQYEGEFTYTPTPMFYDDGSPMLYDDGTQMYYEGTAELIYTQPNDEWWRVLAGVAPTAPVKVTASYGVDCGCGGAPLLEVEFGFTSAIAQPWRPMRPAALSVGFGNAPTRPTYRFRKRPSSTRTFTRSRARREYQAVLRGTKWCPVGDWTLADVQAGGGEGYVTIKEAIESTAKDWTPVTTQLDCRPRYVRLIFDEVNPGLRFETVRWTNWNYALPDPLSGIPCDCPVEVIELVHIHMVPGTGDGEPVLTTDVTAPGSGDDICAVGLNWANQASGTWYPAAAPDGLNTGLFGPWGAAGGAPAQSGWPPVGCNLQIARNCPPESAADATPMPVDECPHECAVVLNVDGTWTPAGFAYDRTTFPTGTCQFIVAGQNVDPIVETVTETVPGVCATLNTFDDPIGDLFGITTTRPPRPPVVASAPARCMPAVSREIRMAWRDNRVWDSVVPVIDVYAGTADTIGVEILVWSNPLGLDPADDSAFAAFSDATAAAAWTISKVPAGSTIRIDGRTRQVLCTLPGGRIVNASRLLEPRQGGRFGWPMVTSAGLIAVVRAGRNQIDPNASASLWVAGIGS